MEQIVKLLKSRDKFVIAGHTGPDGDTIGSCLGLAMALAKMGKETIVVLEPTAPKYHIIPGREYLYHGALEALSVDVFIALDCADTERLGAARVLFNRARTTVCIDHHETNEGFAEYNLIDPAASSTAEMVFGVIEALIDVDADIAAAIYSGMVGDTGGFRYASTSRSTMEIAARLMETGIPFTDIYSEMLHRHSFEAAKAFGLALGAACQAMDGRIVYTFMTREMLVSTGADSSDMDSVVEYLMNTRGADVALFLYERHLNVRDGTSSDDNEANHPENGHKDRGVAPVSEQRKIKVSMRSKGVHVGRVAASLGGGGHRMAAGCTMVGTMDGILKQVLEILERELETED